MAFPFTKEEVAAQLEKLYFHAEPATKQRANSYLMRFQESPAAWAIAQELLADPVPHVQFMGAQTFYLKVKRQWDTHPEQAALIAALFAYLRDGAALQAQTCLRLALCISALVVRALLGVWPSALEDVIQFGRECPAPQSRYLAAKMLTSVPDELQDLPQMLHMRSSPTAQALVAKVNLLVVFILECIETSDLRPGGLCEIALQCIVQWTKALKVRFCENVALSQCLVQLLRAEALAESLLEVFIECLQNGEMASSVWKVKDWPTQAPGRHILANGPEGMCLRALLDRLRLLHPRLEELCTQREGGVGVLDEKQICVWARVAAMVGESYTQLLFEEDCEFLLRFLGCCFRLSPSTAQPVLEFWGQVKEMQREELLSARHLQMVLARLTEPCVVSLLQYVRRDSSFSAGAPEDLEILRDMAKDVACDVYCLWSRCDARKAHEFVAFLSERLMQAVDRQDSISAESALILFQGITDVLESPLPAPFVQALRCIPSMPEDEGAVAAAAVLLQRCAPHANAHVDILQDSVEFLLRALPVIPQSAAECISDWTGYAGHHLAESMPRFLAAVEQIAPLHPVKVDGMLFGAVVCTVRRLPPDAAARAFASILQGTMCQLVELSSEFEDRTNTDPGMSEAGKLKLFRLIFRVQHCVQTLEQTPEDPDGPPPRGDAAYTGAAPCILTAFVPCWTPLARLAEVVLLSAPAELRHKASTACLDRNSSSLELGHINAMLAVMMEKILRSCILSIKSAVLTDDDAKGFARLLLQLLVGVESRGAARSLGNGQALSLLAALVAVVSNCRAPRCNLQSELTEAFQAVCKATVSRAAAAAASADGLPGLTPLFDLLISCSVHLEQALFLSIYFGKFEQLCVIALACADRELNRSVLQFLLKYATSSHSQAQQMFARFMPTLAVTMLLHFHKWPAATRMHSSNLFSVLLERYGGQFQDSLLHLWGQPGAQGVHTNLNVEQREVCACLFLHLRGPRLKAFLGDLAAVANSAQTFDALLAYQLVQQAPRSTF